MKICLLNDTHFGIRGDSQVFFDYFMKFFDDILFPYLKKNNINTIIHAGDFMDRRKYVNFKILHLVREHFIKKIQDEKIKLHCILGNHDVYYKNTNQVNSLKELFGEYVSIYETPTIATFDGLDIALLPWINNENYEDSINFIRTAPAPILIGHLELDGYQVLRGVAYQGGLSAKIFDRYEKVYSGHFHCKQTEGNITYLGTQYQMTFSDLTEEKGFHILDTYLRDVEFITNPYKIFHSVRYNDKDGPYKMSELQFSHLKDCYVRLFVEYRKHPNSFDQFMNKLYSSGAADITIVESIEDNETNEDEMVDLSQDTISLINGEIDSMGEIEDKDKMKKMIKDLHMESLSI